MTTKHPRFWAVLLASLFGMTANAAPPATGLFGFSRENARQQRELEQKFDAGLDPMDQRRWMESMSSEPNHVGSPKDRANAEFMLSQFRAWGWDAHIETFYCLYPTPISHALELVAPTHYTARLVEPAIPGDRTSAQVAKELPAYNVYGADGDVTAELIYVNKGMPDDYEELARSGVSVKGRIVIARYGGGWRGLKPKLAHEHGAVGCIIYSDPQQDGYFQGAAYPDGPWRPAQGIQRGSVLDLPVRPGDPLTPDIGATKDAKRLSIGESETVLKIPVMPISYQEALPLLSALAGPVAPENWRGALPITYHLGPGPAKVHLQIASEWSLKPVYDVIAVLKGSEFPDEWVVRGNHHDGWVFGACDPLSGNVALMSEAKAIGSLARTGWRPKRTLVYCGWDGEEPGLLGSTEWGEEHAAELQRKVVLYVNSDGNGRGFLRVGGSQALERFVNEVSQGLPDPETGASVYDRRRARRLVDDFEAGTDTETKLEKGRANHQIPLDPLGGGTDFTVFLQHLGIMSLDLQYGGETQSDGIYHSAYDSFDEYVRFGDPGFVYGVLQAKTAGRLVLRAAAADVVPLQFRDLADCVSNYLTEVRSLADKLRADARTRRELRESGAFRLAQDPTQPHGAPAEKSAVPFLDFAPLDNALDRLQHSAAAYDDALAQASAAGLHFDPAKEIRLNHLLQGLEQLLLTPEGLPGRPWHKHLINTPGLHTGYGVKTLPGMREAIETRDWATANRFTVITATALNAYSDRLDQASSEIAR